MKFDPRALLQGQRARKSVLCWAAVSMTSSAMANIVYVMHGGYADTLTISATVVGLAAGFIVLHVGQCVELLIEKDEDEEGGEP